MKAFLLAAGYGTRLKPITDSVPKCLAPIQGRPLLGWWIELLQLHGVTDVLVNTHYLADQVANYVQTLSPNLPRIRLVFEPQLVGSGGTVRNNLDFIRGETDFFICYADNLTSVNLSAMLQFHRQQSRQFTMGLFHAPHPDQCGIAEVNDAGLITAFEEKPHQPKSDLANAGIYIAGPQIADYFPADPVFDFGYDVLPKLMQAHQMSGFLIRDYLLDIGTMENYARANKEWSSDYFKNAVQD